MTIHSNSSAGYGGIVNLRTSRGTNASPTILQNGDEIGYIKFEGHDGVDYEVVAKITATIDGTPGSNDMPGALNFYTTPDGSTIPVLRMKIDNAGGLRFNSGYGSAATAYGCRAWVNFNGTGTIAIRGSGNVSSITDGGVGIYTVNFTTAMVDTNYATVNATGKGAVPDINSNDPQLMVGVHNTSSLVIYSVSYGDAYFDQVYNSVAIFR